MSALPIVTMPHLNFGEVMFFFIVLFAVWRILTFTADRIREYLEIHGTFGYWIIESVCILGGFVAMFVIFYIVGGYWK